MTKNQTIDLLKSQLPGFYSVEQVINLIEKIEDGSSRKITTNNIEAAIENTVRWMEREQSEFLDMDRAEFELNYDNRIELVGVPIDTDNLREALENEFLCLVEEEDVVELERVETIEDNE